jgi:translation initiation factor IF-2
MSSFQLAFKKRLEETKLTNQSKQSSANGKNYWLSANAPGNLKSTRQPQATQQPRSTGNPMDRNRMHNALGNRYSQNNGSRVAGGAFQRNTKPNNTDIQKSQALAIRERLAQRTGVQPRTGNNMRVGPISEVIKPGSLTTQQQPRNNSSRSTTSIREMLSPETSTLALSSETNKDMTDVSNLRAAFLKTVKMRNKNREQDRKNSSTMNTENVRPVPKPPPAWRRDGVKGFRKRVEENQKKEREKLEQRKKHRAAVNRSSGAFFMTQEDYIEDKVERQQAAEQDKTVTLPPREITVTELSALFRVKIDQLMTILKSLGERPKGEDHLVDLDVMELLAMELGLEPVRSSRRRAKPDDDHNLLLQRRAGADAADETDEAVAQAEVYESLPPRPPVVCIMGHVDHGKTTLMDSLRRRSKGMASFEGITKKKSKKSKKGKNTQSNKDDAVAGTEAGGITQVISAFQVPLDNQENAVTFLDTPGHAAFRAMRESGSNAADVIVLVVAADDGVSPQTIEIINFYKSIVKGSGGGGISMVVAMTKIDKHGIDVNESRQRIENQLLEHGILSESFGSSGDSEYGPPVQVVPVSGLTGEGVDDLIEGLVLQSEIMDLRADEKAQGEGIVMDARMEKGVGVVADCIIRWGSLERGSIIVSGVHSGKIKALKDINGATIKKGVPSQPVRIYGFKSLPKAGDPIVCVHSEEVADQITERREALLAADQSSRTSSTEAAEMQVMGTAAKRGSSMEAALAKYGQDVEADNSQIRIPVIIRADGEGSLAALKESLVGVGGESSFDIVVDSVYSGIGPISTSDVRMAVESGASIFSFGIKQNDKAALSMAEAEGVEIRSHDVIYSLLDDAKKVFAKHLPATRVEIVHGKAKVQAIFDVNNKKDAERIAGLAVLDGTLYRENAMDSKGGRIKCHYRVLRNGEYVSSERRELVASSLRKVKEDVDNVRRGEECGLGLLDFTDFLDFINLERRLRT